MAEELNTTKDMIHEILTKDLNKRKVCARFVPHALNEDQEIARVEHCKDLIKTARRNCTFLESIVTGDETWCFKTVAVREFLAKKQVCVLQHPPYSPDLSPCDYFLFPKLKLAMKGTFYDSVTQVQEAVTRVIEAIPKTDIKKSMLVLVERA
ncbi:uncharacterized protein LOC113562256 [Ooceraea biroi]|uniref:uncharacterized protein LOC113562256 n=1 Tax=Ooceraea biroi TaxID=2015173 RepID=UPI000F09972E|nr:uncharacterized protein LOC113562256 [Ooceraea biroi]